MRNKLEMMPEPVKNEESEEGAVDATKEEEIVEEGQESKPEGKVAPNPEKHEGEMEEEGEEEKVADEIKAKFVNRLARLHARIEIIQCPDGESSDKKSSDKEFPDKKKLRELLEEIDLFSEMKEGAKRKFLDALSTAEEFRSDEKEFINAGLAVLDIIIHLAIRKKLGDARIKRKGEEIRQARQARSTELSTDINQTSSEQTEE